MMSEESPFKTISVEEILNSASDLTQNQVTYANVVRVNVSGNEVILDFYFMGSDPTSNQEVIATRLHRFAIPLGTAKEMSSIMLNHIANWENTFGVNLPLQPIIETDQEG
jgi:hypothetical protein